MSAAPATAADGSPRSRLLVAAVVLALLATVLVSVLRGSYRDGPLEPDAPTPQGSRAVVRVLEDLGTEVTVHRTTADAATTLRAGGTVLVTAPGRLGGEQLELLASARAEGGGRLVLLAPDFVSASVLAPGVRPSATSDAVTALSADAGCGQAAFGARTLRVRPVEGVSDQDTYYSVPAGAQGCFAREGASAVVVTDGAVVIGSPGVLSNEGVREADASALALNALADPQGLGWYVPSATDPMSTIAPTVLDHLPPWAGPLALWLLLVAVVALAAVSRRHGPVVVEPLPVTVRAQELTLGRARLMHRARAHQEAARALRAATASRLAHRLGVHREARLDVLVDALAPHTRRSPEQLHRLLGPAPVADDRALVRLAHDLDRLEKEISR